MAREHTRHSAFQLRVAGLNGSAESTTPTIGSPNGKHPLAGKQMETSPKAGRAFLNHVFRLGLLGAWGRVISPSILDLAENDTAENVGDVLVQAGLLTKYQLERVLTGNTHGLVIGNYRILDRLGAGGMGIVYLGEHVMLNRRVAIKMLPIDDDCPQMMLDRFCAEMQVLASLHHPNIVMAFDSGKVEATASGLPALVYLAMEFIDGCDLEKHVKDHGPVPVGKACRWVSDAACGLQEAHNHKLIHRDVKPSNILLTKDEHVKLVDFGLVRQFSLRLTDPNTLLGTLEFMSPEQSYDPTTIGSQADVYSLGATLFWLLTGEAPFRSVCSVSEALALLQRCQPRPLRQLRPDAPRELEAVIKQLLDKDPTRRPAMPLMVQKYLAPFAAPALQRGTTS